MKAQAWHNTLDTHTAAAAAALGTEVRIQSALHTRTSTREVRFLIAPLSPCGQWKMGVILKALRDKSLVRTKPDHPVLVFLRAFYNRGVLLEIANRGSFHALAPVPGAPGVHQYQPAGAGLPGIAAGQPVVATTDLKMAAALATAGFPLLRVTGSRGAFEFTHAAFAGPAAGGPDAARLVAEWRRDDQSLPWELPFTRAAHALRVLERLLHEVRRAKDTIILSKPRTSAHATIHQDAAPKAWDKVSRFFSGVSGS